MDVLSLEKKIPKQIAKDKSMTEYKDPTKDELNEIHKRVKHGFTYVTDEKQYGVIEKWVEPYDVDKVTGDCEDFALACRKLCREANIRTRLILCKVDGAGHLVLSAGGYIFDNNESSVRSREFFESRRYPKYEWLKASGHEPGDIWHTIE